MKKRKGCPHSGQGEGNAKQEYPDGTGLREGLRRCGERRFVNGQVITENMLIQRYHVSKSPVRGGAGIPLRRTGAAEHSPHGVPGGAHYAGRAAAGAGNGRCLRYICWSGALRT